MRKAIRRMTATVLAGGLGLAAFGAYALGEAPAGVGAVEAVRVALDPGAEYAVLHVEGMT